MRPSGQRSLSWQGTICITISVRDVRMIPHKPSKPTYYNGSTLYLLTNTSCTMPCNPSKNYPIKSKASPNATCLFLSFSWSISAIPTKNSPMKIIIIEHQLCQFNFLLRIGPVMMAVVTMLPPLSIYWILAESMVSEIFRSPRTHISIIAGRAK